MATNGAASFVAVPAEIKIEKGRARSEGPRPWHEHPQQRRRVITKIWERLFLGSLKDADHLARTNPQRINTVISLCREQAGHRGAKITYMNVPIADSRSVSMQKFEDIMFAITIGVRRGNLLVHCLAGMSRSPIMVAAYMSRCGYAGIDKALDEIAELRDIAPSPVLLQSVKEHLY
jgi:atypical dual specificity phosphatase